MTVALNAGRAARPCSGSAVGPPADADLGRRRMA